ncbi:hypothetical protein OHA44_17090 [Streptomyces sp. NBC_00144]|uniref:hypothetical protein n=1 Tax=Streptomyces sp. NBC_00144 TaxID=2975665 RepID=UPI003253247F
MPNTHDYLVDRVFAGLQLLANLQRNAPGAIVPTAILVELLDIPWEVFEMLASADSRPAGISVSEAMSAVAFAQPEHPVLDLIDGGAPHGA